MVHICTPNSTHFELSKKALGSGVNVLIEKPMTEDVTHANDLVELAISKGLLLQVGHLFRFANIVRKIKQLIESKELGEIYYLNMSWTHLIPPIDNVDVIFDLLPHPLDIINFITDKWPIDFTGIGKTCRREKYADVAILDLFYDNFFANVYLSWLSPERKRILEVIGSRKSLFVDCVTQTGKISGRYGSEDLNVTKNNTIRDEILNFMSSLETGTNNYNTGTVGAQSIATINQAKVKIKIV